MANIARRGILLQFQNDVEPRKKNGLEFIK